MEIYLGEFSGVVFFCFPLIALDNLASVGEVTENCGDAASAVLQRKRRAGTLERSPRCPLPLGALLVSRLRLSARCPPRRAAGLRCSLRGLRRSKAAMREFLPWGSAKCNFKCMLLLTGCWYIVCVCMRMGKRCTGSLLCPMFLTPARGCL